MASYHMHEDHQAFGTLAAGGTRDPSESTYAWIGGRRFFAAAPYLLPFDQAEFNRQNFEHHALRQALQSNVMAPVGQPQAILDVGSGTGRWVVDVAAQFPLAQVVGIDLTVPLFAGDTIQEAYSAQRDRSTAMRSNVSFVSGNILHALPFMDGAFDYVHMRFLSPAIPLAAWRLVLAELARITRRGGWIEVVDTSWTPLNGGPAVEQLFYWARIAGMVHEINLELAAWIGSLLLDTGLGNVTAPKLRLPMGRRAGHIGTMIATNVIAVAEAFQPWVLGYSIATAEIFAGVLEQARAEVMDGKCDYPLVIAYGQRI